MHVYSAKLMLETCKTVLFRVWGRAEMCVQGSENTIQSPLPLLKGYICLHPQQDANAGAKPGRFTEVPTQQSVLTQQ